MFARFDKNKSILKFFSQPHVNVFFLFGPRTFDEIKRHHGIWTNNFNTFSCLLFGK